MNHFSTVNHEFEIFIEWDDTEPAQTGAEATRGKLRLLVDGQAVWHGDSESEGFEWTWIELLEYLTEVWVWIVNDEVTPEQVINSDLYYHYHDLAEGIQGAFMPSVCIGNHTESGGWVATERKISQLDSVVVADFEDIKTTLTQVARCIVKRLASMTDDRSVLCKRSWQGWQSDSP